MNIKLQAHIREFDGRVVYRWAVTDDQGVVRGGGCELTRDRAIRKAQEFRAAMGPDRLLAMLEMRLQD